MKNAFSVQRQFSGIIRALFGVFVQQLDEKRTYIHQHLGIQRDGDSATN
jgi:hypothetical protein